MERIPFEEYLLRLANIKESMAVDGLDALLVYSWKRGGVRYLSGYHPNYVANLALVILPRTGEPALRIRFPFDLERARQESWIQDVAASGSPVKLVTDAAEALRQQGLARGRIGLVTGDHVIEEMPYSLYARLLNELPEATFIEAGYLLRRARHLKSPAEFALLRASARLADAGAEAAYRALQPGCTEYEVVAAAEFDMRRLGAETCLVVISSKGATELVGPPETKVIEPGDNVILEIAVQKMGYTAQVARVFYTGGPTHAQAEIYRATFQAYQAGVAAACPGNTCAGVAAAIQEELTRHGLGAYLEQDLGHGIGIDLPEPPRLESQDPTPLEEGMALVIHPAVRIPSIGGAFLGGTVLVHTGGAEPIHSILENPNDGEA